MSAAFVMPSAAASTPPRLGARLRALFSAAPKLGRVILVGAGPGDPELLTLKALRALQSADVVIHDQLVDPRILAQAPARAPRLYVGKRKAEHSVPQEQINAMLVAHARTGATVVRLKGGDPFIFGRGGEELEACRAAGIPVETIPGITAALGCGAATGIPLTHRDWTTGVSFVTGHQKADGTPVAWSAQRQLGHTVVVYMGLSNAQALSQALLAAGYAPATPAAIIERGTRPDQELVLGSVADLGALAKGRHGPALLVIGEVVRLADLAQVRSIAIAAQGA
jgi:uroporphyrin-III C-methyltransferase / precorrin-2 dehydrogenase / sirohydrochlorin ferrochelatase